ncbi:MAG TPA: tetratricopeptide repeat protein [Polyangiaceae bacterium]|nr:tetratricopeptide repeat protein [Polyangiaceae bacterium]
MKRRALESPQARAKREFGRRTRAVVAFGCLAWAACGGAKAVGPAPAPTTTLSPVDAPSSIAGPAPSPSAAPVASATPAPAASNRPASARPPPRPVTIALASGRGGDEDAELVAADQAFERGDLGAAEQHYRAARSLAAKDVAPAVGLARVRIARVDVPLDFDGAPGNKDVMLAASDLARATKAAPTFGPAFVELGRARLLLGDAGLALDALRKGVELLGDEPEAHSQLGVALLATGHAAEAARELARAAELDPGSAARHGNLGTALMMAGRTKEAVDEYRIRVGMDDADARAHSDLGTALLGTQDLAAALAELERAVQLEPQRATFRSNLGYAMQQSGRFDRAIVEYREALRLDPKLVSAWINLATALARDPKTRAEARAALERARALSPGDPRVNANMQELDALEHASPKGAPGPGVAGHP